MRRFCLNFYNEGNFSRFFNCELIISNLFPYFCFKICIAILKLSLIKVRLFIRSRASCLHMIGDKSIFLCYVMRNLELWVYPTAHKIPKILNNLYKRGILISDYLNVEDSQNLQILKLTQEQTSILIES